LTFDFQAEEWAEEASRRLEEAAEGGPEEAHAARKHLQLHLMAHPAPPHAHFQEMASLCEKLNNQNLTLQCQVRNSTLWTLEENPETY